jgi:hypothetical protein
MGGAEAGWGEVAVLKCAYCDDPCRPTREHVIPDWYNDTPGEAETFSARAPLTHLKGDLIVRDVCGRCNSGVLSALDGYGKELYDRYFALPVYAGETVAFDYDGDRLIRWLLKLSYNSARAQNADVRVLREYRKAMLGEESLTDRIRCWVHLVSATSFDHDAKVARPARRAEQGAENVEVARWFRICQFRLTDFPALSLVQRTVLITSFAFTLLIARPDAAWPCPEFGQWVRVFASNYPAARPVVPVVGSLRATTGWDHAAVTMYPSLTHYPSRYTDEPNPYVEGVLKGKLEVFMLHVPHELIEAGKPEPVAEILRDMVSSREKALAYRQRVGVLVDGYNDDPRGIWEFPKARAFFRRLFEQCPFVMLLSHPEGGLLGLIAACWVYEEGMTEEVERQRMQDFLHRAFYGLNGLNHTIMLSEEQNREICIAAAAVLFGEVPPLA